MTALAGLYEAILRNDADVSVMTLTDSTGADYSEWPGVMADCLAKVFPTHSVRFVGYWNGGAEDWGQDVAVQSGTGPYTITVWNGGGPGYGGDEITTAILEHPDDVGWYLTGIGINLVTQPEWESLLTRMAAAWPNAYTTLQTQNPTDRDGSGPTYDYTADEYNQVTRSVAQNDSLPLIDTEATWLSTFTNSETNALMEDGVHPNADGSTWWGQEVCGLIVTEYPAIPIPDGTTWTDTVGNVWTANGTDLTYFPIENLVSTLSVDQAADIFTVSWLPTQPERIGIYRDGVFVGGVAADASFFVDEYSGWTVGDSITYLVRGEITSGESSTTVIARDDTDPVPYTYGDVDALASTIRYADIVKVKRRIGVEDTAWDTEITQAIISAETAMDLWWGRSFPDTGANPRWPGIPVQVSQAAENIAVAVLKQTDAPFGIAGSDAMMGELDIDDTVRRELHRSPLLRSFKVKAGFGLAR